jgi:hypothetical protein
MQVSSLQAVGEHVLGACIAAVTLLTILFGLAVGVTDLRRYLQMRRL